MDQRLRRMGRHIPPAPIRTPASMLAPTLYIEGCARGLSTCDRCVPSCDLYVDERALATAIVAAQQHLDPKPRRGGRHRRQR